MTLAPLRATLAAMFGLTTLLAISVVPPSNGADFDLILRGGTICDGSGGPPYTADLAIRGDRIAEMGQLAGQTGDVELDVRGLVVAPGFINMLSWAVDSLIEDGRSESDIRQGVTLEIFGEGVSWGPWNRAMKQWSQNNQGDIRYEIEWSSLREYLEYLTRRGVSPNVASFVGATTVRIHELGFEDRAPSAAELKRMQQLVREAMEDGALGLASSLIYAPAFYAKTAELTALSQVAADYDGLYITHMRSEGNRLLEGVDEVIQIARQTGVRAEIYHLKAAGQTNWHKLDEVIQKIETARGSGLQLTADMYTYTAAATGLDASMPPWVQEGGYESWRQRLQDARTRLRVLREMRTPSADWENLLLLSGSPEKVLLIGFKNERLKPLTGKSLAEVARLRGRSPEETAMDLVIEDGSRVDTVYFLMSEENLRKQIQLPWVSFGSDAQSLAPRGVFLKSNVHPRAYGTFARLLGKYVRDEQVIPLPEAIRRLTSLPAENLKLVDRGRLRKHYFADVVVLDPDQITDHATYAQPHQFSTGIRHVFVNGQQVLREGDHTGALPGRIIDGPGKR